MARGKAKQLFEVMAPEANKEKKVEETTTEEVTKAPTRERRTRAKATPKVEVLGDKTFEQNRTAPKMEDVHKRMTFLVENEIADTFKKLTPLRGDKIILINEALAYIVNKYDGDVYPVEKEKRTYDGNRQKKSVEDSHTRMTFMVQNHIAEAFNKTTHVHGAKIRAINEALTYIIGKYQGSND